MTAEVVDMIQRARDGESGAWRDLVAIHAKTLERFIYRFGVTKLEDIEDCAQEAWLRVSRGLAGFKAEAEFQTWLFSIARNCAIDHFNKRKPSISLDGGPEDEIRSPQMDLEDESPDGAVERRYVSREILSAAMDQLRPDYRTAIHLRYVENKSLADMAKVMGRPSVQTMSNCLQRAKGSLEQALADLGWPLERKDK